MDGARGPEKRDGGYSSVRRAVSLLNAFDRDHRTWSVGALSRASGLHKSVVTRLLATLAQDGLLVQDPTTRHYGIGPKLFALGSLWEPAAAFGPIAQPILDVLARRCGHSCGIMVQAGKEAVVVATAEAAPSFAVRVHVPLGTRRSVHLGASGKALLAGLSDDQVRLLVGPGPIDQRTSFAAATLDELLEDLAEIRERGYAINRQEVTMGSAGVAAPVLDSAGRTIASLFITFPNHLVDDVELRQLARETVDAAAHISRALGGIRD